MMCAHDVFSNVRHGFVVVWYRHDDVNVPLLMLCTRYVEVVDPIPLLVIYTAPHGYHQDSHVV